ncbi:MAG: choice-of-anchor tandem repeat GloVer-containing protein [Gammaproteobacteria bacterium]
MNRKTQLKRTTGTAKLFRLPVCSGAIFGLFACIGMLAAAVPAAYADTGTLTTLYSFGNNGDGATPYGALVQDADGNFYGTTYGAIPGGKGTVYKITPSGTLTTLHSFNGTDGANPEAGLVLGSDGNFYGTTSQGGTSATSAGTVFKITPAGTLTTLYSFCATSGCPDGQNSTAGLIQGSDGDFYGTTFFGGANLNGTVFKITPSGTLTTLYSFDFGHSGNPNAALVEGSDGNFYGTTERGGLDLFGTVFKITPTGTYTRLHSFTDGDDGESPQAALLLASDGNFYSTTAGGGVNGYGTAFKITPSGTLTTLHAFDGTDGSELSSGLIEGSDGNFYGTAYNGGDHGVGDIYRMTPGGTVTVLHSFASTDGNDPLGALVETTDGSFYGTTFGGGPNALTQITYGTVFKLSGMTAGAPPAPSSLVAVPGNASVMLTWIASSGADSYNVYQGTSPGGEAATPVQTGITGISATINGLSNGTVYYFTVAAVNGSGTSAYSNEVAATPAAGMTATPTFNPAGGSYSMAQSVTLSDTTTGAAIFYTTDGSTPTTHSTQYNKPIDVSATETIKAIAAVSGSQNSAVATATYTIMQNNTQNSGGGGASSPALLLMLVLALLGRRCWPDPQ